MDNNFENMKIAVLGGDKRQIVVAEELLRLGCDVRLYAVSDQAAFPDGAELFRSIDKAIEGPPL